MKRDREKERESGEKKRETDRDWWRRGKDTQRVTVAEKRIVKKKKREREWRRSLRENKGMEE